MEKKKVVLAFSGGLDTSYCAIYLAKEMGLEVHAALANTGGFSAEELAKIEKRAYDLGVKSYVALDVTQDYYNTAIKYMIFGNVLKNATYPISVSSERMSQATAIAKYAEQIGADYLCHGSTGAGNDQVRFDMVFNIIAPEIEVIALIREKRLSREEEISYLRSHGVDFDFKKAEYSINQGIWGTSVGGKETLTSSETLPEEAYPSQLKESKSRRITLTFEKGALQYNTYLEEAGNGLSGGEKQRIALARAFLKDSNLYILDESTSNLDFATETLIFNMIYEQLADRSMLIVAHRLSTIRDCDLILVMDHGKIVERGTHDELLAKDGRYAELWNMQQGIFRKRKSEPAPQVPSAVVEEDDDGESITY